MLYKNPANCTLFVVINGFVSGLTSSNRACSPESSC